MAGKGPVSLEESFSALEDPRADYGKRHLLLDMIIIAICAVICGADSWVEVELFGRSKEEWLRTFLGLPHGIPSHDTFGRVFQWLDPEAFGRCFREWTQRVEEVTRGQVVAVDGKTLRRSYDRASGKGALEVVSAWATANRLILGQVKVGEGTNEITAIPELLEVLEIAGCIVTVDALGCQEAIAQAILERGADYVLALKGNQGNLYETVIENQVHWVLDVVFREDACRIRKGSTPQNMAILRHIALSLLQREQTEKVGIKAKSLKAALDENYLLKVLAG